MNTTKYQGRNGAIELHSNRLVITRKMNALKRMLTSGDSEIFLDHIKSVRFKKANKLTWGYIQFETSSNTKQIKKATLMSTPNDDFTVNFTTSQEASFIELKEKLNNYRSGDTPKTDEGTGSLKDLEQLANLKDKGIISQDEFDLKKKQILGL